MPGIDVQLPPLIDRDLYRGGMLDLVEEALYRAIPYIEELMLGVGGNVSRVPFDTGELRASHDVTVGLANTLYEQIITLWWNAPYASYLIEHAGQWRAHHPGTELDWRPWAISQSLAIAARELDKVLVEHGLTAEFLEATR